MHPNNQIYERVVKILSAYFSEEQEEINFDETQATTNTFNF